MKKLLFTDLDGTLLDLQTYSADKVKESVNQLKKAGVAIIFCSSKTWTEQEYYLTELQLDEPVIVENGSGIILPKKTNLEFSQQTEIIHGNRAIVLGRKYNEVVQAIESSIEETNTMFKYYNNQTIDEIAQITGLTAHAAQKAKTRDFSETLFDARPDTGGLKQFEKAIKSHGFQCISGSRYVTISGIESNKGTAVSILVEAYTAKYGKVKSIGIGDSRNDLEMLESVQFPYLVKKPENSWAEVDAENISKISAVGPDGWNIMAQEVLAE